MSACTVCDARIDVHGRDGTRCGRCNRPCPACGGDVMSCSHPLPLQHLGLANLTKAQWDAARAAAGELMRGNPAIAHDRANYRDALATLTKLLPADADAKSIVIAAMQWNLTNTIAAAIAEMPADPARIAA